MRSRSRLGARVRALLLAALLPVLAAPAFAETPEEAKKRLDDRMWFVQQLRRGGDSLIADMDRTIGAVGNAEPLLELRAGAYLWRAGDLLSSKDPGAEAKAFGYFEKVANDKTRASDRRDVATNGLVKIWVRRGKAFENLKDDPRSDDKALEAYEAALVLDESSELPYERIGGLSKRIAEDHTAQQRYDDALSTLQKFKARLERKPGGPVSGAKALGDLISKIYADTGEVRVWWLGSLDQFTDVKVSKTTFRGGQLTFESKGSGAPPPKVTDLAAGTRRRVRVGDFTVHVSGAGQSKLSLPLTVVPDSPAAPQPSVLEIPVALPDDMQLVHAGGGVEAFLMDRTEVPISAFLPFATEHGVSFTDSAGDGDLPARGVDFDTAAKYAGWAGKDLPDLNQWRWAAHGTPDGSTQTYPWGETAPEIGTHFIGGATAPAFVKSCDPGGASAFGVLNLAGNVMEWVKPGWAIGGRWTMRDLKVSVQTKKDTDVWEANLMWDPIPIEENVLAGKDLPDGKSRGAYPPQYRLTESKFDRVGIRCVIPLGKPRENP
jgi:hypothetical protein